MLKLAQALACNFVSIVFNESSSGDHLTLRMNNLKIDQALAYVRKVADKNHGDLPDWKRYQDMVKLHLSDAADHRFKMPPEYYYAYLREKGLTHEECLERMGLPVTKQSNKQEKKSFWKFW